MEDYNEFYSYHMICDGDILPIYIDNEEKNAFFICTKCDQETFDKAGIIL